MKNTASLLNKAAVSSETGEAANALVMALTQTPQFGKVLDMTAEATHALGAQPKGAAKNIEPL